MENFSKNQRKGLLCIIFCVFINTSVSSVERFIDVPDWLAIALSIIGSILGIMGVFYCFRKTAE
jgi:hypothetical protein